MIEVQSKSGLLPTNQPILAEFRKGNEVYSGCLHISAFPEPVDSNPIVDLTGTSELKKKEH